ncbi:hypothetical protein FQA39_LY05463 [Lamprigera yunnana]|nr:hypothetical protein FQA39_LY05463 [Lamprigera yunnana]
MHSRGKKLVNLALLEGNKQVDNNATPTGSSEVQMNDYVPSATSSSESELDVGGNKQVDNNATPTGSSEVQMNDYVPSATSSSESELDVGGKSDSE